MLMAAARTIWPKVKAVFKKPGRKLHRHEFRGFVQHGPPFLLLCAFAVENALKGTRVRQIRRGKGTPVFAPGRTADHVWGHDLPQLARAVGLSTSPEEDELLHVLVRNIEWAGRYPRTLDPKKGAAFVQRYGPDDLQRVARFIARVKRA